MEEEYQKKVMENIGGVLSRIHKLSGGRKVKLLFATKTVPAEVINGLPGEILIGENKVQELEEKYPLLRKDGITVHFIGHLQTNKVKKIIDKVSMIHSLDSLGLAEEISHRAEQKGIVMPCLVEINIAHEPDKGGVFPAAPEHKFYAGANFTKGRWSVTTGLQYIAGLYTAVGDNPRQEDFALWNLRGTFRACKWLNVWARGENLLAQKYEINAGYPMPRATFMGGIHINI